MRDGKQIDTPEIGFIAQDLQQALIDTGYYVPRLVDESDPEHLSIAQGRLLPVMVKAIQDLKKEIDDLKAQINASK
jgi:hypothetical protein